MTNKQVQTPSVRNGHGEIVDNYTARVDLKWSLWSMDKNYWEQYAPGVWDWAREWFEASTDDGNPESAGLSDAPRVIHTAPWKEIRFGTVEFQPGSAKVHFWAEFDDDCDATPPNITITIEAETFDELMARIDAVEQWIIDNHDN
jgi:hypothetical protein